MTLYHKMIVTIVFLALALLTMFIFVGLAGIDKGPTEEEKSGLCDIQPWEHTWQLNLVSGGEVREVLNFMGIVKVNERCIFWTPAAMNQRVYCGEFYLEELTENFFIECGANVVLPRVEEPDASESN